MSVKVKVVSLMDEKVLKASDGGEPWSMYLVQHLWGDEIAMMCPQPMPASARQKLVRKPRPVSVAKAQVAALPAVSK